MTARRWLAIVFSILLATAILLVLAALHAIQVVRQPDYPRSTGDPALELQDSAFRLRNQPCDIVIYGDSTANVGIDPRVITARTGLTACNIATNRPDVDDLGTLPLDAFLAHNPRPKLIVLQFGPEDFYRAKSPWEHVGPYTPLVMLARDTSTRDVLATMLHHPAETVQFVQYILQKELFPGHIDRDREFQRALDHAAASHGQLDLNLPALTECHDTALPLNGPLDTGWIAQLRARYRAQGIPVLIRAAPVPPCDPQLTKFRQDLGPWVDGNVETLPTTDFVAGSRHTTQQGSEADTLGLVALIQSHP